MFKKILIANRGESGRGADASAKPNWLMREAHAGEFPSMEKSHV